MLEGLVHNLLTGYLGRYIKDFQKDQIKITLWNEEVLLENVELILEAFDFLQLPFALKQGRVGKLSIKIPWKKLGWDPIIIILEDILVCASQRDDEEWGTDAVERREIAAKKAELHAAELVKLSRRVCDDQAGKSFISYITAKIIDGIQVSIRNFHIIYRDMPSGQAETAFGLKVSSLTATKQSLIGVSSGKVKAGQVNKLVEIQGLEIYCSTCHGNLNTMRTNNGGDLVSLGSSILQSDKHNNLLAPVNVSVSLLVNRSGRLEHNTPQYSVDIDSTSLVFSLDVDQLKQVLSLCDYLITCRLREKYGRYRPWRSPLSKRFQGWQIAWWHYAQQAILSDVRKKMMKTSWKYLGERLNRRRRYVKLYKKKLECLTQEQLDKTIVLELDQMEKEYDIDDILSYRSAAERELQDFLENSSSSFGVDDPDASVDKLVDDEQLSSKPQGWLKWLSRGMLGAGGTDDSSQFSGIVSDAVIKDIYEATKFHPVSSSNVDVPPSDEILLSSIKFSVHRISATLYKKFDHAIAELIFEGVLVECMIWQDSAVVSALVNSVETINPLNGRVVLLVKRVISGENFPVAEKPSLNIHAYAPTASHEGELTLKVMIQPLEVKWDSTFFFNMMELYDVLESFKFQQERVLISLNGISDVNTRLKSKVECIFSSRKKVMWDISLIDSRMIIPWDNAKAEAYKLVLELAALSFASKRDIDCFAPNMEIPLEFMRSMVNITYRGDFFDGFRIQDLYDYFEIKLNDFEIMMLMPSHSGMVPVVKKFNSAIALASCIVPDESLLKTFEVFVVIKTLLVHFSPSLFGSFLELAANINMSHISSDLESSTSVSSFDREPNEPKNYNLLWFSAFANLESANFLVDLENDSEASSTLMVSLQELGVRCTVMESTKCWICTKALKITSKLSTSEDSHVICLSKTMFVTHSAEQGKVHGKPISQDERYNERSASSEMCFILYYEANRNLDLIIDKYKIWLGDLDIHCYPYIVGLLVGFYDKISSFIESHAIKDQSLLKGHHTIRGSSFNFQSFGCSNFVGMGSSEWASIPVVHYPFVTINNVSYLLNLERALIYTGADWRKILNLRGSKVEGLRSCVEEEIPSKSTFNTSVLPTQLQPDLADLVVIDMDLSSVRMHFHDTSCIIATVALPNAKCLLSIHQDRFDVMCSTAGLNLSSSWWPQSLHDFLWGPALSGLSPVLNLSVKKGSVLEIDFSIQHVSCILPPEFLAIIIGYFSLPDWNSNVKKQDMATDNDISVTWKLEILDSTLFAPVDSVASQFLKLDIQQLYVCFMENSDLNIILKEIPSECLVSRHKFASRNHSLNFFVRDLSLYLIMLKTDVENKPISLIAPISADVWITIPLECESSSADSLASTCVMSRVTNCQLIAEGGNVFVGYEALQDVIDQFSSVDKQSQCFTSDVFQFLQVMRSPKENVVPPLGPASVILTEISCRVQSMSVNFYCTRAESSLPEHFARTDMQFLCSSSLRDDTPLRLDVSFFSLTLSSVLHSLTLVECIPPCPNFSVLDISMLMSDQGENQLLVSLPSLDLWLYLLAWSDVMDLFNLYSEQLSRFKTENADEVDGSKCSPQPRCVASQFTSENIFQNHFSLLLKSEAVGIRVHVPIRVSEAAFKYFGAPQIYEQKPMNISHNNIGPDRYCFLVVSSQSRYCELVFTNEMARLEFNLENTSGTVELCQDKCVHVWPFFQLLQIDVEAEITDHQVKRAPMKMKLRCDSLDVWFSHHIFYFWRCMLFDFPEADSSQFPSCDIDLTIQLQKISLLLTDRKLSSNGPLLEILMRILLIHARVIENKIDVLIDGGLEANYNNIHKVLWEPFLEPWKFQLSIRREYGRSALQTSPVVTDMHLESTEQLNINITESFIEIIFRTTDMIQDACDLMGLNVISDSSIVSGTQISDNACSTRYAPYVLQNLTSLPLVFHVCEGPISVDVEALKSGNVVLPGSSYPVYIDDTPEEQFLRFSRGHSSDKIDDKQVIGARHRYIIVQLEGTSRISHPISIDLVGINFFEVDFSNSSNNFGPASANSGYIVPVVIDVSVQRFTKLVRLYSTVILLNASSVPIELRFDIPFGVAPKALDPIYPGQEFPLPLHLAESGRIRWRPLGNNYLWSEAYSISSILSNGSKIGAFRSFICYPSLPSSDPFRCCIMTRDICLPSFGRNHLKSLDRSFGELTEKLDHLRKRFIHLITLSSPLVVKNYLPVTISLTVESGGATHTVLLSEVETSLFHIDSSHDLAMAFHLHGFGPSVLKFPRVEAFSEMAKFSGTKFTLTETISFNSDLSQGPLYVTVEKVMDAFSGAREICISVPFLLYNCSGFPLVVSKSVNELNTNGCVVPSCYDIDQQDPLLGRKEGLSLFSSNHDPDADGIRIGSLSNHVVSTRKNVDLHDEDKHSGASSQSNMKSACVKELHCRKVNFCMYSPEPNTSASDIKVRIRRFLSESPENTSDYLWSNPFFLVPPTGSTTTLVPQTSTNAAYVISVTSSAVDAPFTSRTRIINFQPRYVISNACNKDLCYKQKGSDFVFHLRAGQHSHIHMTDVTRELLVSVRFDEPGWQWSGCFLPEHLGDTQLKMRNYVSGTVNMMRVEVQNADISTGDEKIVGNPHVNSGTNVIILSDDDTGFMPYRIDNFSKEKLRIYQQKCEAFETVVHSYTSCPYAWDEPCYPHRLTVEVPAERIVGSYTLDDAKEYKPVHLPATPEKPERTLLISIHSEGALKVLSVIDSSYHTFNAMKGPRFPQLNEKREHDENQSSLIHYKDRISVAISFIGISVMNSYPQELLFICARNTQIEVVQSLELQKYSFRISSLQIDNQLQSTPYPVILSFDHDIYKNNLPAEIRTKDDSTNKKSERMKQGASESSDEPVFSLAAAKWRNKDIALISFKYISLRLADFHLELEQEVILSLFDFFKTVSSRFLGSVVPHKDPFLHPLSTDFRLVRAPSTYPVPDDFSSTPMFLGSQRRPFLPCIVPIGAPGQQIYLLARKQKKIYVELIDLAPIKLTLSFSSTPWMLRNGILTSGEYLIHRGLMALADIEGAQIHLRQLTIAHQLASWESIQEILLRHYTRQLLHEMYKVFGSAGVIGNPMGFARSVGHGIRDFLSVPAKSFMQSPAGVIAGMAHGTTSLLSNTVYALSDAATQFSRAAHKGIVAFTFDDAGGSKMEKQQKGMPSHGKGVINEVLEGLTGLLQSPIKGAERHGLPGVVSGIALGVTGLVARPAASILEVTEKTARSIRNRSKLYQMGSQRLRLRLPRPLRRDLPLRPYSWEDAIGVSVLADADDSLLLKDEVLVLSKALKEGGKFVITTERLILIISCSSLVNLGKPEFRGVPADPDWVIETEIRLDSVIHADCDGDVVHIVGSSSEILLGQSQKRGVGTSGKRWYNNPTPLPLFQTNLEFSTRGEAAEFLPVLLSTIEKGKERGWGCVYRLHQSNLK